MIRARPQPRRPGASRTRFGALALAVSVLACGVPARAQTLPFPEVRARLLEADTVVVEHVRATLYTVRDPRGGERHRYRTRQLSVALADTAWGRRFARALLSAGPSDSLRRCVPRPEPGDSADARVAGVTFRGARGLLGVLLFFGSRCAQVFADGAPVGSIDLGSAAEDLLAQAQQVLPADSAFARMALVPADSASRFFPLAVPTVVDSLPRAVTQVAPRWPEDVTERGPVEVALLVLVDENGTVADARVKRPRPPFDRAALDAVREWRFQPARRGGHPVRVWVEVPITFRAR